MKMLIVLLGALYKKLCLQGILRRYSLSTEIKDYKFLGFKINLCNHHSYKPGHIPAYAKLAYPFSMLL